MSEDPKDPPTPELLRLAYDGTVSSSLSGSLGCYDILLCENGPITRFLGKWVGDSNLPVLSVYALIEISDHFLAAYDEDGKLLFAVPRKSIRAVSSTFH